MRYTQATSRSPALTLPALFLILSTMNVTADVGAVPPDPCSRDCVPTPPRSLPCVSDAVISPLTDFSVERESDAYAAFFLDARSPDCTSRAKERLEERLGETFRAYGATPGEGVPGIWDTRRHAEVHPFHVWLAGSMVTQIFAAARELDGLGLAADPSALQAVEEAYLGIPRPLDPGCALPTPPGSTSCVDDLAMTASGYAWIAAWEALKGRDADPPEHPWATLARGAIADALRQVSDAGVGSVGSQRASGFGLEFMTNVASACAGLSLAGTSCSFSDGEKAVASELYRNAQENASQDGCFFDDTLVIECPAFADPERLRRRCVDERDVQISTPEPPTFLARGGGYRPTDFPLHAFYERSGISGLYPPPYFQFDRYCESRTTWSPGTFWGPHRKVFYQILAYELFLPERGIPWSGEGPTVAKERYGR